MYLEMVQDVPGFSELLSTPLVVAGQQLVHSLGRLVVVVRCASRTTNQLVVDGGVSQ